MQLEKRRLDNPVTIKDRKINYLQRYDIGAGKRWLGFFSKAIKRAHGLRHGHAQERMSELIALGLRRSVALETVSQEMGHFRPEVTEIYLC